MTASGTTFGSRRRSAMREFGSAVLTIMTKELRSRMRGRRAFIILTAYLGVLALITYGVYVVIGPFVQETAGQVGLGTSQANASRSIGQWIFSVLSVFQIILVSMMAPAFTAGQISLEREKQTLDLLISTPMRPSAIVIGKLVTALAFVVLMIVAAIPITAIVLMYGGASVDDIIRQQVLLLSVAVGFGAIGLFASALMRRTQAATVVAYGAVLALTLGSAMTYTFWTEIANRDQGFIVGERPVAPEQLRWVNPMIGMLDIVARIEIDGPTRFTAPLYQLFGEDLAVSGAGFDCANFGCGRGLEPVPDPAFDVAQPSPAGHWWPRVSLTFLAIAAILTIASMRLVVPPGMRWALRRRRPAPVEPSRLEAAPMIEELGEAER
ncbi:MAG TPA: ABC transporter permease subunit [Candidatus Limnocylindria bacterium]|nr:ABC transporter permease subunit [Candidatus Limnocylindria bacterium]